MKKISVGRSFQLQVCLSMCDLFLLPPGISNYLKCIILVKNSFEFYFTQSKGFFVKKWLLSNFSEKQKFNDDAQQTKSRKQSLRSLLFMESINTVKRLDQTLSKCYQY